MLFIWGCQYLLFVRFYFIVIGSQSLISFTEWNSITIHMFKILIYLYIYIYEKSVQRKIHTFLHFMLLWKWVPVTILQGLFTLTLVVIITMIRVFTCGMSNIVDLLITLTLHCFPMIILITLYFQDIYANPLSLRVMWPHRQYSSRFSLRYSCNITNVYPWVTAAVSHSSCKNHAYFPWFL